MSQLKGAREAKARAKALEGAHRHTGRDWAARTVRITKQLTPSVTGKTRRSIRAKRSGPTSDAQVVGNPPVLFIDRGTKAHDIVPVRAGALKFKGHQAVFRPKAHKARIPARPYVKRAARLGLEQIDLKGDFVALWNRAA